MISDILKVLFVIIGTFIGAGFASGKEIYLFFFSYGTNGIIGIIISIIIIGIVVYKTLNIVKENNINTYKEFLDTIIGKKSEKLKKITNFIINSFILVTFFIMIAGFGAYFEQQLGVNSIIGSSILVILCFFIFMTSTRGIVKANGIVVPLLIIFIIYVGIKIFGLIDFSNIDNYTIKNNSLNFIIESILYSSYNSILLIPVLITLKDYLENKKIIKYISILTVIIILILTLTIYMLLLKVDVNIENLEMPAVYTVSKISNILSTMYGFVILSSIFTTSISLGGSFLQNIASNKKSYTQIAIIMCITSLLISKIGFSNLVNILYPIFGYLGLIQIYKIVKKA